MFRLLLKEISINGNKIDFVGPATNLGIVFNNRLSWSNHITVIVGRTYSRLQSLWAVIDSSPFAIRMKLAKTYLISVLLYRMGVKFSQTAMVMTTRILAWHTTI